VRLFRDPVPVLSGYEDARLEQGFWFIVGCQLAEWLWDGDLPLDLRVECIRAMPSIFQHFFPNHPLDQAVYMWWDMLRHFDDEGDQAIIDSMAVALQEILSLPNLHCQMSALHGLGHLHHESKEMIIRRFLNHNPNLDPEIRAYAESAIAGQVL
jgi:hypothetical protein